MRQSRVARHRLDRFTRLLLIKDTPMKSKIFSVALACAMLGGALQAAEAQGTALDAAPDTATAAQAPAVLSEEAWSQIRGFLELRPDVAEGLIEFMQAMPDVERDARFILENPDIFQDPHLPVLGNPEGSITLVKFNDYACPHCRNAERDIERLIAGNPDLRVLVREFPILGPGSLSRARLAMAIHALGGQDAYEEIKLDLFASGDVDDGTIDQIAGFAGLDPDAVRDRMQDPLFNASFDRSMEIARALNISGTPAFIVGTSVIRGRIPLADLRATIARETP